MSDRQALISELTSRVVNGDHAAWGQLLRLLSPEVLAYIERHMTPALRASTEPADILQDVYLAVARKAKTFKHLEKDAALRWLLTLARRRLITLIRELATLKRGGDPNEISYVEVRHGSVILQLQDLAVYSRTPSKSAAAGELRELVSRSVNQLSAINREVLQLRYIQGLSIADTAKALQRTPHAVSCLCDRALSALRRELGQLELV